MSLLQLSVYLATVLPKITIPWKVLNCDRDHLLHRVVVRNGCQASFSKRSLSRSHAALFHSWKKKKPKDVRKRLRFQLRAQVSLKVMWGQKREFSGAVCSIWHVGRDEPFKGQRGTQFAGISTFCISYWKYTVFWWDHNERAYFHPNIFWSILSFHKVTYDFFFHSYASPVVPCIFQPQQTSHRVVHFKS